MAEDRSGIYVISIVAVVAVVGLVTLFMRGGEAQQMQGELVPQLDEDGNIAGQAWMLRSPYRQASMRSPYRQASMKLQQAPMKVQQRAPAWGEARCKDTDVAGGSPTYNKGTVSLWTGSAWESATDYCRDANTLIEQGCLDDALAPTPIKCECRDGACVFR